MRKSHFLSNARLVTAPTWILRWWLVLWALWPGWRIEAERLGPSSRRTGIVISEIMYHPSHRPGAAGAEFIELYNSQPIPEDIGGWRISGEWDYAFASNTVMPPGAFLVVAPDPARVKSFYGITNVVGGFTNASGNSTNTLPHDSGLVGLRNRTGAILLEVQYSDQPPWPAAADGAGHSLVLARPSYGERDPRAWAASKNMNGSPGGPEPADAEPWSDTVINDPLTRATPGATNAPIRISEVVINEIMYHPPSNNSDDEYVELYNRGTNTVALGRWRLMNGIRYTIPTNVTLAPGSYLVVAKNAARLRERYPHLEATNVVGNFKGKLAHGGERITLTQPGRTANGKRYDIVVDDVRWHDGGRWGRWSDGGGSSLELREARTDHRHADHWGDSDETGKSAWTNVVFAGQLIHGDLPDSHRLEIIMSGAGECLIEDVQVIYKGENLVVADDSDFNHSLGTWIKEGNHEMSFWQSTGGISNSGCLHLCASGRGDYFFNRVRVGLRKPIPANATATLRAQARWLRGEPDIVLRLTGNFLEAVGHLPVPPNLGTPGAANTQAANNTGPAIFDVTHSPVLPAANQPVMISARVCDPDGVTNVTLQFRVDPNSPLLTTNLVANGTRGDAVAGDGTYSVILPGKSAGQLLAFRIVAFDSRGASNCFPHFAPVYPADTNGPECLVRFGEANPAGGDRRFSSYHLWMTQAMFNQWSRRGSAHNGPLDCTLVYEDQRVIYNAGVFYSGSFNTRAATSSPLDSLTRSPLAGYNLILPADDKFLGATDLTLDPNSRPGFAQHEQAAFWVARELGLPSSHRRYVNVILNGNLRTVFEDAQQPGRDFVKEFFPDDSNGDLYKVEVWWRSTDFPNRGSYHAEPPLGRYLRGAEKNLARYRWTFQKRAARGSPNDYRTVFQLVDALATPMPDYTAAVERVVEVEEWMRVFALERIVGNHDSWGRHAPHNMYAYKPANGRWQLVPYDMDYSFYGGEDARGDLVNGVFYGDAQINSLVTHPPFLRAYLRALKDANEGPLAKDPSTGRLPKVDAFLDANYQAISVVNEVGKAELSPDHLEPGWPWSLRGWFSNRHDAIVATLRRHGQPAFTARRTPTTAGNPITLTGTAPIEVKGMLVNGGECGVTWTSVSNWQLTLAGTNPTKALVIEGIDRFGHPLANCVVTNVANSP